MCDKYFKTKHGLNNHTVFHYEPKFACSYCDYKTPEKVTWIGMKKVMKRKNFKLSLYFLVVINN